PTAEELADLTARFGEISTNGKIETRKTQVIDEETLVPEFPRVVLKFDRRQLGKLRMLIDALNTLPSLPPEIEEAASETSEARSVRNIGEIQEEESLKIVDPGE